MTGGGFGPSADGRIRIDVWSDVMCPFCYMGDALLERALTQFEHRDTVDVEYHSFLLMPDLPVGSAVDLGELLASRRGIPREQAEAMNAQVAERGREIGLDYRFDRAVATNTRRAHELSHFAERQGRQHEMIQRLFRAYFTEGANVGDREVLTGLAAEVGLDPDAAAAALASGEFADAVDADIRQAQQLGITGVPFFVFEATYAISGAQPVEVFAQALQRVRDDKTSTPVAR
ncbi:DsbA family oxidoreductase [Propionicicella superfundia]|uniref:DsbA family oxidoreductase n=1 Tax=Propionicicella superfundia TaxID=348582 RepID=UPI000419F468|nr:DsbA family oxidoreductase [Propionicicella superfundia]